MIKGCALASGSSGNCFYIETNNKILIDAGLSCKRITDLLGNIGKDSSEIDGIFITHEHSDHVRGADVFSRKHSVPVFINKETYDNCCLEDNELINIIKNKETIKFNGTKINSFPKSHSAADPVGYSVEFKNKKAAVITDFGFACNNVITNVRNSNLLFIESNHDIAMLDNGPYPIYLKRWIKSEIGHLSNYDCAMLVLQHASNKLKKVVLSHLSENNNLPEIALNTFNLVKERKDLNDIEIMISPRHEPTKLIEI